MSRIMRRIAILLTLLSTGCGADHQLDLSSIRSLKYSLEGTTGHPRPLPLAPRSREFESLVDWLKENRTGWSPLEATLLPGGVTIYGDSFELRVVHNTAVLRYLDESGQQRLLHKKIPSDRLAFLME